MSTNISKLLQLRAQILQNIVQNTLQRFEEIENALKQNPNLAKEYEKTLVKELEQLHGIVRMVNSAPIQELIGASQYLKPLIDMAGRFMQKFRWVVNMLKMYGAGHEVEKLVKKFENELKRIAEIQRRLEMHEAMMRMGMRHMKV